MRVLITGITGFAGSHLAEYLLSMGGGKSDRAEVYGTVRHRSPLDNISGIIDRISLIKGTDIRDAHSVEAAIKQSEPDYIFHLAGQSLVPASWVSPVDTLETNVIGTVNLLEAVRRSERHPVIQIAGSSEEYGCPPRVPVRDGWVRDRPVSSEELERGSWKNSPMGIKMSCHKITDEEHDFEINSSPESKLVFKLPITEDFPLLPLSPYGVSKVAEDLLGFQYHKSHGMKIVRTRAFNHSGPRRSESFVASNFAKQIAEIEKGKRNPVVKVGNLEAMRDFTDVRDVVRGYWLAASRGKYGEVYNICSGKAVSIQTVLDTLRMQSTAQFEIVKDKERMRPSDIPVLQGSCSKFMRQTGWKSQISFSQTMGDLLDYWRGKI